MKVKIDIPLSLDESKETLLLHHSFVNVLAVLSIELHFLEKCLRNENGLREEIQSLKSAVQALSDRNASRALVQSLPETLDRLLATLRDRIEALSEDDANRPLAVESLRNLEGIREVAGVRVAEVLDRERDDAPWKKFREDEIAEGLRQVFRAIAANSHGRYGIVFEEEAAGETDYVLEIDVRGPDGVLTLPPLLVDVLRDLAANARKYSPPGEKILARLVDTGNEVELQVSDRGRGIPEEEIKRVVAFGARGSNTAADETRGGGFGLTKAYYVCRRYGGAMWIESARDAGCTVALRLPRPAGG